MTEELKYPQKVPKSHYEAIAQEYITAYTATYQEIGDRYGVSREAIRLIVAQIDPDAPAKKRQRLQQRDWETRNVELGAEFVARCQRALTDDLRCVVCDGWILRTTTTTCSQECAKVWPVLRHVDDNEEHRRQQARTILDNLEHYGDKPSRIEWAKRMLSDNPPPPNRRYFRPGSKREQIIKKYRPAEWARITGDPDGLHD